MHRRLLAAVEVARPARPGRPAPAGQPIKAYVPAVVISGLAVITAFQQHVIQSRLHEVRRTWHAFTVPVWTNAWRDVVEFEIVPVRPSAEAAQVIASQM